MQNLSTPFYLRAEFAGYSLSQIQDSVTLSGYSQGQMSRGKGAKQTLHSYLDHKFNEDFRKLSHALEHNLNRKDAFLVDKFLERIPDLSVKDWEKKVSVVPQICTEGRFADRFHESLLNKYNTKCNLQGTGQFGG